MDVVCLVLNIGGKETDYKQNKRQGVLYATLNEQSKGVTYISVGVIFLLLGGSHLANMLDSFLGFSSLFFISIILVGSSGVLFYLGYVSLKNSKESIIK